MEDTDGLGARSQSQSAEVRRKPKGRFGEHPNRSHQPRNFVYERVNESALSENSQADLTKPNPVGPKSKRVHSHPNRRPYQRNYYDKDKPTERNWRERECDPSPRNNVPSEYPKPEYDSRQGRGHRGQGHRGQGHRGQGHRTHPNRKRFDDMTRPSDKNTSENDDLPNDEPALTEDAQSAAASSSLNVQATPFFPQLTNPPSSQHMTKLGHVKQTRSKRTGKVLTHPNTADSKVATSSADSSRTQPGRFKDKQEVSDRRQNYAGSQPLHNKPNRNKSHKHTSGNKDGQQRNHEGVHSGRMRSSSGSSATGGTNKDKEQSTKPKSAAHVALHSFIEKKPENAIDIANLREHLIENLVNGSYECAICYGTISQDTAIWNCGKCYQLFHFYCIKRWGNTLIAQCEGHKEWRCPTCQEGYNALPNQYRCFCSKIRDPVWNNYDTPHSCGEVCGKKRADNCSHRCTELCHPGPCPPCNAYTSKHCNCGRSYQKVKCSQQVNVRCSQKCNKKLNCGKHSCTAVCHLGACAPCDDIIQQVCHCGLSEREITCGSDGVYSEVFSCLKECGKALSCGNHNCAQPCHSGSCPPCNSSPEVVKTCNCGKVALTDLKSCTPRSSCTDSVPSCDNICGRELSCGTLTPAGNFKHHTCQMKCHEGECTCQLTSDITCRCGQKRDTVSCAIAMQYTANNPYKCEKKCTKKRECGRHRCGQCCCTLESHPCMQICGKRLSCGTHKCQELCHLGNCPTCYNVSFDELNCHCGVTIMYPPIPCGTKPPECPEICNRMHECEHGATHRCHSSDSCPPCAVLTSKLCMGEHEMRYSIPCWMKDISCGRPCERPLPCADHRCPKTCHKGDCGNQVCKQPCPRLRETCKHPCGAECHVGAPCPPTDCHQKVVLRCECENRQEEVLCYMKSKKLAPSVLAIRMKELSCSISIPELLASMEKDQLECDKECAKLERNHRIAVALDICNPELLAELGGPLYSEFLKAMARKDPVFIAEIERALSELVYSSQQSKHPTRNHAFKPMKRDQRQAVHELAEFYGCSSVSYDDEPKRNVVATAQRGKCELPSQTLTSLMKSEKQPRPPMPIPMNASISEIREKSRKDLLSKAAKPEENKIDYFDMTQ